MSPVTTSLVARRSSLVKGGSLAVAGVIASLFAGAPAHAAGSLSCTINQAIGVPCDLTPGTVFGQLGDKELVFQGFQISQVGTTAVDVVYNWDDNGTASYGDDLWTLAVSAAPNIGGPLTLSYAYDVNIKGPGSEKWFFDTVSLESDVVTDRTPGVKVTKGVDPESVKLMSINGVPSGPRSYKFLDNYKTIRITDTIVIPSSRDKLTSVTNAWTQRSESVPGPLPILGGGVAFGFSRRLRRRIGKTSTVQA